jgi:hypothetical protein
VYASTKPARAVLEAVEGGVEAAVQGIEIVRSAIGEAGFGVCPDALVRIQLRSVGREKLEVETRVTVTQRPDRFALMDRGVVHQHDHVAPQVAQQMAKEIADIALSNVVAVAAKVKSHMPAHGTDRNAGDHGEAIVSVAVVDTGCLSAGRPGPPQGRDQEEARFVDEDEVRPPARCVFFTCTQRIRFQCSIRPSSRSSARRSGFCGLRPS